MSSSTCLCHFPDGSEGVHYIDHQQALLRGPKSPLSDSRVPPGGIREVGSGAWGVTLQMSLLLRWCRLCGLGGCRDLRNREHTMIDSRKALEATNPPSRRVCGLPMCVALRPIRDSKPVRSMCLTVSGERPGERQLKLPRSSGLPPGPTRFRSMQSLASHHERCGSELCLRVAASRVTPIRLRDVASTESAARVTGGCYPRVWRLPGCRGNLIVRDRLPWRCVPDELTNIGTNPRILVEGAHANPDRIGVAGIVSKEGRAAVSAEPLLAAVLRLPNAQPILTLDDSKSARSRMGVGDAAAPLRRWQRRQWQ